MQISNEKTTIKVAVSEKGSIPYTLDEIARSIKCIEQTVNSLSEQIHYTNDKDGCYPVSPISAEEKGPTLVNILKSFNIRLLEIDVILNENQKVLSQHLGDIKLE